MAYTIESSYKPFSFQELVTPYMLYKDAYDKQEANLEALYDKASAFSDLDDLPEDSQARKIYDNYMSTLNAANKDFATNGLTMNNRGLYNDIRKRYQGEIGRLAQAKTKVDEINKLRLTQRMQDSSMLYSQENIGIDDLIGKNKPNMYSISGRYLYDLGSKAGATSSSRIWSNPEIKATANKFYMLASQSNGYTPEILAQMRDDFMSIPEFRKQVENAMKANGITDNLKGDKYTQAALNYVNGFVDSCTYKKNDNFMQNPEPEYNEKVREFDETKKMQEKQFNEQVRQFNTQAQMKGFIINPDDNTVTYDNSKDAEYQKAVKIAEIKAQKEEKSGNKSTPKSPLMGGIITIKHTKKNGKDIYSTSQDNTTNANIGDNSHLLVTFDQLSDELQSKIKETVLGSTNPWYYSYWYDADNDEVKIKAKGKDAPVTDSTSTSTSDTSSQDIMNWLLSNEE